MNAHEKIVKNIEEAVNIMSEIKLETEDVGVFTDMGWGGTGAERTYEIIKNGRGQSPIAEMHKSIFIELKKNKIIGENTLTSYKARTFHRFIGGKK